MAMGVSSEMAIRIAMRSALSSEQAEVQREELRLELVRILGHEVPRRAGSFWLEEIVDQLALQSTAHREQLERLAAILKSTHVVMRPFDATFDASALADEIATTWRVAVRVGPTRDEGPNVTMSLS